MLVRLPPIRESGIGFVGWLGEVLLDVVVRGGAAQVRDQAKYRPGPGHQRRDQLEQRLFAPAVGEVVAGQVLRTGPGIRGLGPVGRSDGAHPVGGLDRGEPPSTPTSPTPGRSTSC
ncbi:hypothetical protein ACFWIO_23490 [Streptomyces diastatochromogenes]|uniref:hypothetical protein n=1 Tax=Streptomyces diastatochromogenes TaxID=42236 RepID=UPI00364F9A43